MNSSLSFVTISYRSDLNQLIIRWLREVNQTELQEGYAVALAEAEQHGTTDWLVDSRRRTQSDAAMVAWLETEFLPSLHSHLHKPVRLACLVGATWTQASAEATPLAVLAMRNNQVPNHSYQVRLFSDEGMASLWLVSEAA
jgi:hypothetical protein